MRKIGRIGAGSPAVLLAVLLLIGGCGGGDEEATAEAEQHTLVPEATVDSTAAALEGVVDETAAPIGNPIGEDLVETAAVPEETPATPAPQTAVTEAAVDQTGPAPTVDLPDYGANRRYSVQFGSFQIRTYAETEAGRIRDAGYEPVIETADVAGVTYYRVLVRGIADRAGAESVGEDLKSRLDLNYLIKRAD